MDIDPSKCLEVTLMEGKVDPSVSTEFESRDPSIPPNSPLLIPLNLGWVREVVMRRDTSSKVKIDIYYRAPDKKKFRSLRELAPRILGTDLTDDNFSFARKALGIGDPKKEFIRRAQMKNSPTANPSLKRTIIEREEHKPPKKRKSLKHSKTDDIVLLVPPENDGDGLVEPTNVLQSLNLRPTPKQGFNSDENEFQLGNTIQTSTVDSTCSDFIETKSDPTSAVEVSNSNLKELNSIEVLSTSIAEDTDSINNQPTSAARKPCYCGLCKEFGTKAKCCWKIRNVASVKLNYPCITLVPTFEKIILDQDVLSITRHLLSLKTKKNKKKTFLNSRSPLNITWRYVAYKQFVSWINVCISPGSKSIVEVPSCVVSAVRRSFPEQNGVYRT